jgi:protein SCO1/2
MRTLTIPALGHRLLLAAVTLVLTIACTPTTTTATLHAAQDTGVAVPGWNGVAVDGSPQMPAQEFTDSAGRPYDLRAAMRERPTLVYFGYTSCPDICPVHLANIAAALDASPVRDSQLNVVFVTVDPRRDTPDVLADYMASFDESFVALRATQDDVNRVVTDLGLPEPVIESGEDDYTVGHPSQVLAFDRSATARIAYPFGTRQSQWVADLPKLVREEWS